MKWRKSALLLSILFIIPFIATVAKIDVAKASGTKVSIDYYGESEILDPSFDTGTQFTVNITVDYVEELWAYQFELGESLLWPADPARYQGWNASVLNLVDFANGPFLGSAGGDVEWYPGTMNSTQGTIDLSVGALDPKRRFPTGGGTLATLTFEVVGLGSSPIHFGLDTGLANKTGGWELGPDWEPLRGTLNTEFLIDGYFDNRPQVYVDPQRVSAVLIDNDFTVDVNVEGITDLHDWNFSMRWNATLLNVTSVTEGDFLKSGGTTSFDAGEIDRTAGEITGVSASLTTATGVDDDGTLASLTFTVMDEGESNLTLFNIALRDSAGQTITVGSSDGFFTNLKFHNIEVTSVTPHPLKVKEGSGDSITINATVTNTGSYNETGINVTAYYDGNKIGNVTGVSLDATGENRSRTLEFAWDTTGVSRGIYEIIVNASVVVGEAETADNTKFSIDEVTIYAHDVAITKVSTLVSNVIVEETINVTVVAKNNGTEQEDFDVTAFYDGNEIGTEHIADLGYGETKTLQFEWDTTGVEIGAYTISANATFVEGEEEKDRLNNVYTKLDKVKVIERPGEAGFSLELWLLIGGVIAIVGVAVFIYWRRRKPSEPEIV